MVGGAIVRQGNAFLGPKFSGLTSNWRLSKVSESKHGALHDVTALITVTSKGPLLKALLFFARLLRSSSVLSCLMPQSAKGSRLFVVVQSLQSGKEFAMKSGS